MSQLSRIVLIAASLFGLIYMFYMKGLPVPPAPNPAAFMDVVLQPLLAVMWGLIGYLLNAVGFGILVTLAFKVVRVLVSFIANPAILGEFIRSIQIEKKDVAR